MAQQYGISGSSAQALQLHGGVLGGLVLSDVGAFFALPVSGADTQNKEVAFTGSADKLMLSKSFGDASASGSLIQALNFLKAKVDAATGIGGSGTNGEVAYFTGASTIASDADLAFDGAAFSFGGTNGTTFTANGSGALSLNSSAGTISIGDAAVAQAINIGTGAAARTITVGNDASTKVDLNALAIELDSAGTIVLNSTTSTTIDSTTGMSLDAGAASNFTTSAGALTLDGAAGVNIAGNAAEVDITTTGDVDVNGAGISIDGNDDSNFTIAGAGKSLSIINSGGGEQVLGVLSEGTTVNALQLTASAGGMGLQASKAINIDSTAGSVVIGESLANTKSVLLGKASSTQISVSPNTSAASAVITLANANGTGANAISIGASAGGIVNTVKNTNAYAFEVKNSAAASVARFNGLGGADFAVSASAPRIVGSVSRLPIAAAGASGFALAMSSSALTGSGGGKLDAGDSAKTLAMSDFPAMFLQGVDDEGKLRNYFMQISGGILQLQEGAAIF